MRSQEERIASLTKQLQQFASDSDFNDIGHVLVIMELTSEPEGLCLLSNQELGAAPGVLDFIRANGELVKLRAEEMLFQALLAISVDGFPKLEIGKVYLNGSVIKELAK